MQPSGFKHIRADGTRSTAAPSPAPRSPSPPQRPPKPTRGAEGGEPRPWAPSRGQGHPRGTTLGAKATFPPATALPALPSKPDFNSNVSSGVINKPCNPLLQRAGAAAASAGRNPNPPRHRGREEAFRKLLGSFRPFAQTRNPLTAPDLFPANISSKSLRFQTKTSSPSTQTASAEGSVAKEPVSWISSSRPHFKPALPPRRGASGVLPVILQPPHPALTPFKRSYAERGSAFAGTDSLTK